VVPAKNEAASLAQLIDEIIKALRPMCHRGQEELEGFEIVVVDDGSQDETGEEAVRTGARVVRHPHNVGYGRSLKDGIQAAIYDTIVICDADGTYPAAAIPELVRLYQVGFDMVVGERHGPHHRQSVMKSSLRVLLRFLVEWTAGRRIPDINSGMRVFSRAAAIKYFPHLCETFSFTTSMTLPT
jgi:glycosyltransferase involved in cell wall biosynthesis